MKVLHISSKYLKDAVIDSSRNIERIYSKNNSNYIESPLLANEPKWTNKGIDFSGEAKSMRLRPDHTFNVDTYWHFGCWLKIDDLTTGFYIFDGTRTGVYFDLIVYATGQIRFYNNGTTLPDASFTEYAVADGKWKYYAITMYNGDFYFTKNGILDSIHVNSNTYNNELLFTIGVGSAGYRGYLLEDIILYEDETPYNPTGYSVGERVFQPPSRYSGNATPQKDIINLDASKGIIYGTSPAVKSWMGNNSELFFTQSVVANRPTINTTERAVEFTSANAEKILANKNFDYSKPFTISFWYKLKTSQNQTLMDIRDSSDNNSYFHIREKLSLGYFYIELAYNDSAYTPDGSVIQQNHPTIDLDWHHFCAVYTRTSFTQYIDGNIFFCSLWDNPTTIKDVPLNIGTLYRSAFQPFDGYLDDLKIKHSYEERLVGWTGTGVGLKYSITTNENVFTPTPRKTS